MTIVQTELDLSVLVDINAEVPCSGIMHEREYSTSGTRFHDREQSAGYLISAKCKKCGQGGTRPVCEFYKNIVEREGWMHIIQCGVGSCTWPDLLCNFVTVIEKL